MVLNGQTALAFAESYKDSQIANVIQELMNHMKVLVIGEGAEEVCESVFNTLKDFKVAYSEEKTEEGQYIKIYD